MGQQKFSLFAISLVFLCSEHFAAALYANSDKEIAKTQTTLPLLENDEDEYDDEDTVVELPPKYSKKPVTQNQQNTSQQRQMMRSDEMMQSNEMPEQGMTGPMCCPEICEDCCYCNVCPPTEMITPLGGPCVVGGWGVYVTADYIYWTARQREMSIAATTGFANATQTGVPSTPTGEVVRFDQSYKSGFKVGFGIDFCHDGWDVYAEYTWLRPKYSQSASAPTLPNTQQIIPTTLLTFGTSGLALWDAYWGIDGRNTTIGPNTAFGFGATVGLSGTIPEAPIFGNVSGQWHLQFNVVDLELGRNFYISPRLMLRPSIGLKGTWQKQNLSVAFTNSISNLNSSFTFAPGSNVFMNQHLTEWGIGPRVGLNTAWHFTREFSFLGDLALTGLYEHFSVKRFDYSLFPSTGASDSFVNLKNEFSVIEPIIEWMIGLRYERWFNCDRFHASLDAGWEEQVWFGQNQFLRNRVMESSEGNLILAGLTVHARFDF